MGLTPADDDADTGSDDGDAPVIPARVIRSIEDIDAEDTASKADLESVLHSDLSIMLEPVTGFVNAN